MGNLIYNINIPDPVRTLHYIKGSRITNHKLNISSKTVDACYLYMGYTMYHTTLTTQ